MIEDKVEHDEPDEPDEIDEYVGINANDLVPVDNLPGKIIIPITRGGVIAGTIASSIGYTFTNALMSATSVSACATINGVGYIAEKAAGLMGGPLAEGVVYGARKVFAASTEATITTHTPATAILVSAVAGMGASLTFTAGSVALGAAITMAEKIAGGATSAVGYISEKIRSYADGETADTGASEIYNGT